MKNVEYKTKATITPIHFLAAECNCRAGCTNEPSPHISLADVERGRIIYSHGMMLSVSLSLALYRGLATSILEELRLCLQREDFEGVFGNNELRMLQNDITHLINAAGKADTAMDIKRSILQCLEIIAVSTDVSKKPPPDPKSHDLGLLCEKF
jgi:hypothetical protein